ncbi:armadillo-type protein [Lobosporangium transversale]|uniref:Armadillo-type protein n=1 Tax=Lobosporangium transversale TaxID=64571 RepID=A0A1Y2GEY6_9FUNG|nr:armadillo-type protein [Lobosporangium transversale]ORZ08843.1 armadillo-type protein [Lobosporangium transversale]|eukprot:XP_021878626.1 armadillo-type protein [Lobosporangium transversale]
MDFSRKLLSTLTGTGSHSTDSGRVTEDAKAFSDESLEALRLNISNPNVSTAVMKENMIRLIYGEMMGQDVQFGVIYALKLAQSGQTVAEKRAGYLACYLLLQEGNELNIMLVNTLQKDLTSSNYHHVVVALVTLCNMTLLDVIPSMVGHVLKAMLHTNESVRKRALVALKNFYIQNPDLILPYLDQIKEALFDSEPSVMSAALGFFAVVVQDHGKEMIGLVPALIKILQQVIDGKLPKGYSYHGTPAPWIQIRCLQIMARLGQYDLSASMAMTPVIMGAFHKARQGVDTAFAILFEVIRTLNTFQPAVILELCQYKEKSRNPLLIITKFATSSNQNLKYLGISMLCQVRPDAWSDTWWNEDLLSAVVQALDSRDATIQRKALDLLYRMLTIDNSENIIDRLVYAFYQEQDEYASTENNKSNNGSNGRSRGEQYPSRREKILDQILDAGERFGKSEAWYLELIYDLLERGGQVITMQTVERVMRVFEKGARSPAFTTIHLRVLAVQKTMELLAEKEYSLTTSTLASEKDKVTSTLPLAYFATWILGEYGDIADDGSISTILEVLVRCLLINQESLIQAFIFTALTKITLKSKNGIPANIAAVVRAHILSWNTTSSSFSSSYVVDTQYRAQEFLMIAELTSNVAT